LELRFFFCDLVVCWVHGILFRFIVVVEQSSSHRIRPWPDDWNDFSRRSGAKGHSELSVLCVLTYFPMASTKRRHQVQSITSTRVTGILRLTLTCDGEFCCFGRLIDSSSAITGRTRFCGERME
jgi:hypothetical protein